MSYPESYSATEPHCDVGWTLSRRTVTPRHFYASHIPLRAYLAPLFVHLTILEYLHFLVNYPFLTQQLLACSPKMSSTVVHVCIRTSKVAQHPLTAYPRSKTLPTTPARKKCETSSAFGQTPLLISSKLLLTISSGKITSLSVTPASEAPDSPQSATVTFEKETYATLP